MSRQDHSAIIRQPSGFILIFKKKFYNIQENILTETMLELFQDRKCVCRSKIKRIRPDQTGGSRETILINSNKQGNVFFLYIYKYLICKRWVLIWPCGNF